MKISSGIENKNKLESLADYVKLQSLLEPKQQMPGVTSVPVLMMDATVVQAMMEHIAATNQILTKLIKRPTDLWLTHGEALEFFDVSENTLRGYVDRGWLACTVYERQKYFHWSDIEKFLLHPEHRKKAFQLEK